MTLPIPTEAAEAKSLMHYMRLRRLKFTHIKNETGRSFGNARINNSRAFWGAVDGVSPGFPDFLVIVNKQLIAIELKRLKGSKTTRQQLDWIEALSAAGIPARICKGADEAMAFINQFFKPTKNTPDKGEF